MTGMKLDRMKSIGAALAGLALVAALVPEFVRYRAERHLYEASAIFRSLLAEGNAAAGETATLDAVATLAMRVAEGLAGDSRPLILAGSARLLERRPGEALAFYRRALGIGERAAALYFFRPRTALVRSVARGLRDRRYERRWPSRHHTWPAPQGSWSGSGDFSWRRQGFVVAMARSQVSSTRVRLWRCAGGRLQRRRSSGSRFRGASARPDRAARRWQGRIQERQRGLDFALGGKTAFSSITLRLVDWSGDGRPDILAFGEGPGLMGGHLVHTSRGASLYRNLGNGKWERHASAAPDQLFGESMVMGDFDGDGHPGFATSTSVMDRHDIVNLWKPDNTWKAVDVNELRPMAYVWSVAAADFDGDGRTDLAVAYTSFELDTWRSGVDLLLSPPGGYWERHPLFAAATRKGPVALATGDLEGNGHKDLVAVTAAGETLVFLGNGKGFFHAAKDPSAGIPRSLPRRPCRTRRPRRRRQGRDGGVVLGRA